MTLDTIPFPEVNASLNGAATICLTVGYILIKRGKMFAHRCAMITALSVSALFLMSYLTYHYKTGARTPFGGEGVWAYIYYGMLISHIILAVVILPLIFKTFMFAIKGQFQRHHKWARWTFPLWYYVSVTGVLVYFFLYQWF